MAHLLLEVGQWSFQAAKQYDPANQDSFADAIRDVMRAISSHAKEKNWL